jgi:hypothetical protein
MANPLPFATVNHIPLALGIPYVSLVQADLVLDRLSRISSSGNGHYEAWGGIAIDGSERPLWVDLSRRDEHDGDGRFRRNLAAGFGFCEGPLSTEDVEKRAIGGGRRAVFPGDDGRGAR